MYTHRGWLIEIISIVLSLRMPDDNFEEEEEATNDCDVSKENNDINAEECGQESSEMPKRMKGHKRRVRRCPSNEQGQQQQVCEEEEPVFGVGVDPPPPELVLEIRETIQSSLIQLELQRRLLGK